ncbi:enolase-phosphatase E1-like protein [Leptotrombidium deliense]|uniref:Enolase-phosphatase E1-like protein n=1 Tax=Leptotrombidium deliense TaxID=299467 RepID=A0A443S8S3_9ACAR|nr:enolase-phosphatase E1-like protein [Leptotrombidium deliense]
MTEQNEEQQQEFKGVEARYSIKDFNNRSHQESNSQQITKQLQLNKPNTILLRFYDVLSSWTETLTGYIANTRNKMMTFLEQYWEEDNLKLIVSRLRSQAYQESLEDKRVPRIFKHSQTPNAIRGSILFYMNWKLNNNPQMDIEMADSPHIVLQRMVLFDSYAKEEIKTPVYEEAIDSIQKWRENGIKIVLFSCCPCVEFNRKTILSYTNKGDITPLFDHIIDTTKFNRYKFEDYEKIAQQVNTDIKDMLFLTNYASEARVTALKQLQTVLVARQDSTFAENDVQLPEDLKAVAKISDIFFT